MRPPAEVSGASVGVFSGNRSWTAAFGLADVARGRPVRRHDRFAIRSVTKSFVVTEVLRLVAQGRVGLDDDEVYAAGAVASYYHRFGRLQTTASAGVYSFQVGDFDDRLSAQALLGARYSF